MRFTIFLITALMLSLTAETNEASWEKKIAISDAYERGRNKTLISDTSGALILFSEIFKEGEGQNISVNKYDTERNLLWTYEINNDKNLDDIFVSQRLMSDGNLGIVTYLKERDDTVIFLYSLLDRNGNLKKQTTIFTETSDDDFSVEIIPGNNHYIYLLKSFSSSKSFELLKLNEDGDIINSAADFGAYFSMKLNSNNEPVVYTRNIYGKRIIIQYNVYLRVKWFYYKTDSFYNSMLIATDDEGSVYSIISTKYQDIVTLNKFDKSGKLLLDKGYEFNSPQKIGINRYGEIFVFGNEAAMILDSDGNKVSYSDGIKPGRYGDLFEWGDGMIINDKMIIDRNANIYQKRDYAIYPAGNNFIELRNGEFFECRPSGLTVYHIKQEFPKSTDINFSNTFFDENGYLVGITPSNNIYFIDNNANIVRKIEQISIDSPIFFNRLSNNRNLLVTKNDTAFQVTIFSPYGFISPKEIPISKISNKANSIDKMVVGTGKERFFIALNGRYNIENNYYMGIAFLVFNLNGKLISGYNNFEEPFSSGYFRNISVDKNDNCSVILFGYHLFDSPNIDGLQAWYWNNASEEFSIHPSDLYDSYPSYFFVSYSGDEEGNHYTYAFWDSEKRQDIPLLVKLDSKGKIIYSRETGFTSRVNEYSVQSVLLLKNENVAALNSYSDSTVCDLFDSDGNLISKTAFANFNNRDFSKYIPINNTSAFFMDEDTAKIFDFQKGKTVYSRIQSDPRGRAFAVSSLYEPEPGAFLCCGYREERQIGYGIIRFDFEELQNPPGETPVKNFYLKGNFPNPFNYNTTIQYYIPEPGRVKIEIFDILGRKVNSWQEEADFAGDHFFVVDARSLASGIYFYQISYGGQTIKGRMVYIK